MVISQIHFLVSKQKKLILKIINIGTKQERMTSIANSENKNYRLLKSKLTVTRVSILETRDSILHFRNFRGSSLEFRWSSFKFRFEKGLSLKVYTYRSF